MSEQNQQAPIQYQSQRRVGGPLQGRGRMPLSRGGVQPRGRSSLLDAVRQGNTVRGGSTTPSMLDAARQSRPAAAPTSSGSGRPVRRVPLPGEEAPPNPALGRGQAVAPPVQRPIARLPGRMAILEALTPPVGEDEISTRPGMLDLDPDLLDHLMQDLEDLVQQQLSWGLLLGMSTKDILAFIQFALANSTGNTAAAQLESFDALLLLCPGIPTFQMARAAALEALGREDEALEGFNQFLEAEDRFHPGEEVAALLHRARLILERDQIQEATKDLVKVLEMEKNSRAEIARKAAFVLQHLLGSGAIMPQEIGQKEADGSFRITSGWKFQNGRVLYLGTLQGSHSGTGSGPRHFASSRFGNSVQAPTFRGHLPAQGSDANPDAMGFALASIHATLGQAVANRNWLPIAGYQANDVRKHVLKATAETNAEQLRSGLEKRLSSWEPQALSTLNTEAASLMKWLRIYYRDKAVAEGLASYRGAMVAAPR